MPNPSPTLRRAFATSARRLVNPESPSFVEIPTVKLPKAFPRRRLKGILPKPRNLFPSTRPEKGTPEYLALATPEPSNRRAVPAETKAFQEWKSRMAEKRRTNLREGLTELKARKDSIEKRRADILEERNSERDKALNKAQSEDVRLTLPSVLSTLRTESIGLEDPRREERLEEMRAKQEQKLQRESEERQQLLHELYMTAGDFILTEAQLDKAINEQFKEPDSQASHLSRSYFQHLPPTVKELLQQRMRNSQGSLTTPDDHTALRDVGGALTGGKVPANPPGIGFDI